MFMATIRILIHPDTHKVIGVHGPREAQQAAEEGEQALTDWLEVNGYRATAGPTPPMIGYIALVYVKRA
jgi:hypothetical protein